MIFVGWAPLTEDELAMANIPLWGEMDEADLEPDPEAERIFNSPSWIGKGEPFHIQNPSSQLPQPDNTPADKE